MKPPISPSPVQTERPKTFSLTCVTPVFNEMDNLPQFIPALCQTLSALTPHYEIVLVNDGSRDATLATALMLLHDYPITVVNLSRNFGKEYALTAGLDEANADAVILIDADFEHPLTLIPRFVEAWQTGYDMIYGIRNRQHETWFKRWLTRAFYRVMQAGSAIDMPMDAGDFRLLDRKVVQVLQTLPERNRYMKGLYAWVGFNTLGLSFNESPRLHGRSGFNFRSLSRLAIVGLTAFSELPLRMLVFVGLFLSLMSFGYATYIILDALINRTHVPGWPTLAAGMAFFGGLQLLSVGILGEYIGRIFTEVKGRPNYIVSGTYKSPLLEEKTELVQPVKASTCGSS